MSLNIKNEQTHELVRELAEITGESQTAAVTSAVRERLARLRRCERGGWQSGCSRWARISPRG